MITFDARSDAAAPVTCPGTGNGSVGESLPISFTVSATPSSAPANLSVLSFAATISSIAVKSATTGKVSNFTPDNPTLDLNKQLSDSAFLGTGQFPEDTYSQIDVAIGSSKLVSCSSTAGTPGCIPGSVQTFTAGPSVLHFSFSQLVLSGSGIGIRFRFFIRNMLVLNSSGTSVQSVDFTRSGAAVAEQLPQTPNLSEGQLDHIEDLTGVVQSVDSSTIELKTALAGTVTANVVPTSEFAIPPCSANDISCVKKGQVADIDGILNSDGSFTVSLFDVIDSTSNDWVEGVIGLAPTSESQFQFVVTNFVPASTGTKIGSNLEIGDSATVEISSGVTFAIDSKNLSVPPNRFLGAQTTSALAPGQVVIVRVDGFTAANGAKVASLTANALILRFSRVSGMPASSGLNFQFLPVGPYWGLQNPIPTFETSGVTVFDTPTAGSSVSSSVPAALRALYLGPTVGFAVAKVRQ